MIDTLKIAEELQAGGFSEKQARAIAHAVAHSIAHSHDEPATKRDVAIVRWLIVLLYPLYSLVVAILIAVALR